MNEYKHETAAVSSAKFSIPYGIAFGIIMLLEFIIMQILQPDPEANGWIGVLINLLNFLILPTLLISFACGAYKKNIGHGYIKMSDCIKAGVALCAMAGLIYALGYFIYYLISPEFIDQTIEQIKIITVKKNPKITAKELEMTVTVLQKTMLPYIAGPIAIVMYSFIGLVISAIIGAVVRKENSGAL